MPVDVNVAQQAIGATPISVPVGSGGYPLWLVVANNNILGATSGVSISIDIFPVQGPTHVVPYGEVRHYYCDLGIKWFRISGNTANVSFMVANYDIPLLVSTVVSAASGGTSNVNVAQIAGANTPSQAGSMPIGFGGANVDPRNIRALAFATDNVKASPVDSAGLIQQVAYVGGSICPATGVWRFRAFVTTAGTPININDGTNSKPVLPDGFSGTLASTTLLADEYEYTFPVVQGKTYTVTLGTVTSGTIGA
jgi:hypothetical protein